MKMKLLNSIILICVIIGNSNTFADETYQEAVVFFQQKQYAKAFPILKTQAKQGLKEAMYRLAYLYQNGLGVKQDYAKSAYWYQQVASEFSYTLTEKSTTQTVSQKLHEQLNQATILKKNTFILTKVDTSSSEVKSLLEDFLSDNFFGLSPYKNNYFLPFSQSDNKYRRVFSGTHPNNYTADQKNNDTYNSETELEFQLSLQKMLSYNLFGWQETINFAYTQKVWWQAYSESAPFRETNYQPEIFITIPTSKSIDKLINLKAMKYGFIHESNGQEGYRSRSWNRVYITGFWQFKNLFASTRLWHRLQEQDKYSGYYQGQIHPETGLIHPNASGDDNPDIAHYLGYGDIRLKYLYKQHQFGSLFRYNFGAGGKQRGAIELDWSYPFFGSKNIFWYSKIFSGYGESLIDYNRNINKISFGFSFSRGLF